MEDMTAKKIFRKIPMFDYQAICLEVDNNPSSADFLWTVSDYSESVFFVSQNNNCVQVLQKSLEFNFNAETPAETPLGMG